MEGVEPVVGGGASGVHSGAKWRTTNASEKDNYDFSHLFKHENIVVDNLKNNKEAGSEKLPKQAGGPVSVVNILEIPRLSRKDVLRNLSCRAENSNLTQPLLASVQIDMTCELQGQRLAFVGSFRLSPRVVHNEAFACGAFRGTFCRVAEGLKGTARN